MSRGTACGKTAAQMPLHYPCTDVERGGPSVSRGGLLVAGTDGPGGGGQVIPAPMVQGDHLFPIYGWSGGTVSSMTGQITSADLP